jgi:integrase
MEEAMSKAGVPIIRFHDLRHTFATLGLSAGVSPKVMADILGHASVQITLDLYSHVLPGMQQTAVDAIDAKLLEAAQNLDQPDAAGRSGDQAAA